MKTVVPQILAEFADVLDSVRVEERQKIALEHTKLLNPGKLADAQFAAAITFHLQSAVVPPININSQADKLKMERILAPLELALISQELGTQI